MILPLPIALLRRRAKNAKSPKERHDTAYFAWEASLRLAAGRLPLPGEIELGAPSVGHFVRWFASRGDDTAFDHASILAAFGLLCEIGTDRKSAPRAVTASKLLEPLAPYRNRVLGHGATRPNEFYQTSADVLLAGLDAAWDAGAFLAPTEELVWIDSIEVGASGTKRARVSSLMGLASEVDHIDAPPDDVLPARVYARNGETWTCLYPWVLFEGGELRERVLFFNGFAKSSRFLDYVSGEDLKGKALSEAFAGIDDAVSLALRARSKPASSRGEPPPSKETADPDAFGDYRLLGKLGEGGMGIVYLAEQRSLERMVALKMLPAAAADDAIAVARFQREIASLSKCDHPNVVKILASGVEKGTHYYAMEFVDGVDLSRVSPLLRDGSDFDAAVSTASDRLRADKKDLFDVVPPVSRARTASLRPLMETTRALVTLFHDAAGALQHLHEAGVIHRDVKPANLMLTAVEHRLVIMDLGLAAVGDASKTLTRDASSILGTLRYMPPEQLQRNLLSVDHRADVYSLGATFYELLTGAPFFDGDTEARLIEQILRREPTPPGKANPKLPRDLCVILEKATQKEPKERYATAGALAMDLEAFLEGRPIAARPATLRYLLWLGVRRNIPLAAALAFALVVLIASVTSYLVREHALRREAEVQRGEAQRQQQIAAAMANDLLAERGRADYEAGSRGRALLFLAEAYERGSRDVVVTHLLARGLATKAPTTIPNIHHGPVRALAFSAGGARIASGGEDGVIVIHDADRGTKLATLDGHAGAIREVAFSPDGERLLSTHADGTARTWDTLGARALAVVKPEGGVRAAVFAAAGSRIVTAAPSGAAIWNAENGARIVDLVGHKGGVTSVRATTDAVPAAILTGGDDQTAQLWSAEGKPLVTFKATARVADVDLLEGGFVTTGCDDGRVSVWGPKGGKPVHTVQAGRPVRRVESSGNADDGFDLRVTRADGAVQRWEIAKETETTYGAKLAGAAGGLDAPTIATGRGGLLLADSLGALVVSEDGRRRTRFELRGTVTAGAHRTFWAFGMDDGAVVLAPPRSPFDSPAGFTLRQRSYLPFAYSPDGALIGSGASLVDAHGGATVIGGLDSSAKPAFAGSRAALVSVYGARVVDTRDGRIVLDLPKSQFPNGIPSAVALSPDGALLATVEKERVRLFDVSAGVHVAGEVRSESRIGFLAFAGPRSLVTCDLAHAHHARGAGTCTTWDVPHGRRVVDLRGHEGNILDAALSKDGARLVTASSDHTARVWEVATGKPIATLRGHSAEVLHTVFSADGSLVITASADGTAKIWDTVTGQPRGSLEGHDGPVYALAIAADGVRIATGDRSGAAHVWDARSGKQIDKLQLAPNWLLSLAFAPDGGALAGAWADGTFAVADLHLEDRPTEEVRKLVADRRLPWHVADGKLVSDR